MAMNVTTMFPYHYFLFLITLFSLPFPFYFRTQHTLKQEDMYPLPLGFELKPDFVHGFNFQFFTFSFLVETFFQMAM